MISRYCDCCEKELPFWQPDPWTIVITPPGQPEDCSRGFPRQLDVCARCWANGGATAISAIVGTIQQRTRDAMVP